MKNKILLASYPITSIIEVREWQIFKHFHSLESPPFFYLFNFLNFKQND